jgi:hypothetical protein
MSLAIDTPLLGKAIATALQKSKGDGTGLGTNEDCVPRSRHAAVCAETIHGAMEQIAYLPALISA